MKSFENPFQYSKEAALRLDDEDELRTFRSQFYFPEEPNKIEPVYFVGNSLGLQPKKTRAYVDEELEAWAKLAVEGHFKSKNPWYGYHETVTKLMSKIVGALPSEVVVMNTLTVNLHLMMVSFYRPDQTRFKILIEGGAFPSDRYAVTSQIRFHGFEPDNALIELKPRSGEDWLRPDDVLTEIEKAGDSLALVLLGNVNYLTGQAFDIEAVTKAAHAAGAVAGFDLAHGAGNLNLKLHDHKVDFAVWCSYKYLNSGPGGLGGVFVHENHGKDFTLPRFAGWWGHDKGKRFEMAKDFKPMEGAEGWQLSNPPIFPMAALRASLELFEQAGMVRLVEKSKRLTGYLEFLLKTQVPGVRVATPSDEKQRGCHLSLKVTGTGASPIDGREFVKKLAAQGVYCDFRAPDILRVAPVPFYNSFLDVFRFVEILKEALK